MSDKEKELCPRLIDYLVVVGKRNRIRYPTDDHKDFFLPTDVTVFCQPEGCVTLNSHSRRGQSRDPQFFVFMLTEKDSAKIRYGVCLNFYQCSEKRLLNTERQSGGVGPGKKGKDHAVSLTSLCLISHHPFVSIFHDLLILLKQIIDSCSYRAAQKSNIKDVVWSVLTGHWQDTIPPEAMREIKEIETWILMLLSSPVPVPGKTKVQLEVLLYRTSALAVQQGGLVMPSDISPIFEFALPDHTRFCLVDFPLHLPFELLGVDTAVRVLAAIMLEFKLLLAPTPFVIGVPASFFAHKRIKEVPSDVILVDLDTNHITVPDDLFIPNLPEPDASTLKNSLHGALNRMSMSLREERRGSIEACYAVDADIVDVSCRVSMVKFFNSPNVFGDFSEHTRTLRLYPRPVVALQSESFLRSRPQCTQFITELCRTQAVEYFAECCLCPKNETFVRVQAGIDSPAQIGDKAKWFSESLMPVHFTVYPNESSLCSAYYAYTRESSGLESDSDDNESRSIDSSSSIDDLVFDGPDEAAERDIIIKPLAEVNDVYKEPLTLELPPSDSVASIGSSISSGRSSPASSLSASAIDSEADFARLAENLALKSDSKVLNKTAPKAQALRERTMRPLAAAAATKMEQSQHLVKSKTAGNQTSTQAASQQRLMEDESLRDLVCSKLNLGLEHRLTDEDYVKEIVSFNTPGCCGLASVFHVLEIAHTHYWCKGSDITSPCSSTPSTLVTPSASSPDLKELGDRSNRTKLPSSSVDTRTPTRPVGAQNAVNGSSSRTAGSETSSELSTPVPMVPPPLPPRELPPRPPLPPHPTTLQNGPPSTPPPPLLPSSSTTGPPKFPPPERRPPPVPPRPVSASSAESSENVSRVENAASLRVPPNSLPVGKAEPLKVPTTPLEPIRHYIYQDLILPAQNPLWQKVVFWENAFVDVVAQERDIVGMDQEPSEMIDRYAALSDSEKKRLELEEDRLLSTLLHNLTAYMIMCGTGQKAIQQKIRRLLGKAHIGLVCSKEINKLLDELPQTQGNSIPLKPLGSRLVQKHSFTVHAGSSSQDDMMFMECRELYQCVKNAMERAAARGRVSVEGRALGGEFPVHDTETNQGGLLQVRCDGVAIIFANSQQFIDLANIKKCNTFGGNVFLLEEFDRKRNELIQRRYYSQMADQICYAVLCVFSFAAAGHKKPE
ncbi:DENN domain protein [Necator americanus]|uniref:MAP kinase-activating death domain protein n=1 Tax=Necator americanus TaxID=51031 RepID=W2SP00_NECAM|nr:DENN domain protein [Necator americanus]ETN71365.1 DENN domain protein [Necator americanus]